MIQLMGWLNVLLAAMVMAAPAPAATAATTQPATAAATQPATAPSFTRQQDIVYGRSYGAALTMDVLTPTGEKNGAAVVLVVSGGWVSVPESIGSPLFAMLVDPFLRRGYTVFAVCHACQPKFQIPEVVGNINRAVRFIRLHAKDYGIDADRIGITGASAGGHLSCMMGVAPQPANEKAVDPVDRVSSHVQVVACFFPPTDFLNYGKDGENAIGRGVLETFKGAFYFQELEAKTNALVPITDEARITEIGKQISPVYHVDSSDAPTLIIHGDADTLVPIQQAESLIEKLKSANVPAELVTKKGGLHGWPDIGADMETLADWFDRHLAKKGATSELPAREKAIEVMRRACDYQLAEQAKGKFSNGWIRAAFYAGVMAAHEATKDQHYLDAAVKWSEEGQWTPRATKNNGLRFADNQACAQTYTELYLLEPADEKIAATRAMFDVQVASPKPGREEWWWCDALFMAPPAMVRLAKATGDAKYIDLMSAMWWDATDFLFDTEAGLYYRDKNYFDKKTANGKKVFWSRGNGWVMAGTARVLQYLPADHPQRQKFLELHKNMAATIVKLQGEDGLWRPSLLDAEEFPTGETSGTGFFCYALAWGINNGTLDRATYQPHALRAWNGLANKVNANGRLTHVQRVAGAPGKVNLEDTHEYAVGALLLAGSEVIKLTAPSVP